MLLQVEERRPAKPPPLMELSAKSSLQGLLLAWLSLHPAVARYEAVVWSLSFLARSGRLLDTSGPDCYSLASKNNITGSAKGEKGIC